MLIFSTVVILLILAFVLTLLARYLREDVRVEASGSTDIDFRVFYLDNDVFPSNPIPPNLHFLMSFTDYIEVESRFSAAFCEEVAISYDYSTVLHFIIRHMGTSNGELLPVVLESSYVLSESRGHTISDSIDLVGTTHAIHPRGYIERYLDFMAKQARQMEAEGMIARGFAGFSAELLIEFTYGVTVPEWDMHESITRGYQISLSTEVYSLVVTGVPAFNGAVTLTTRGAQITMPMIMLLAMVFILSFYVLLREIKKLQDDPNERKQEAQTIMKKYSDEIVVSESSLPIDHGSLLKVRNFGELLKLAVTLNKHIMCYHNENMAEFAVVVDRFTYYYKIGYVTEDASVLEVVAEREAEVVGKD